MNSGQNDRCRPFRYFDFAVLLVLKEMYFHLDLLLKVSNVDRCCFILACSGITRLTFVIFFKRLETGMALDAWRIAYLLAFYFWQTSPLLMSLTRLVDYVTPTLTPIATHRRKLV